MARHFNKQVGEVMAEPAISIRLALSASLQQCEERVGIEEAFERGFAVVQFDEQTKQI